MAPPKTKDAPRGTVHGSLLNGLVTFTLRAVPLPPKLVDFLLAHTSSIAAMQTQQSDAVPTEEELQEEREAGEGLGEQGRALSSGEFWAEFEEVCGGVGGEWVGASERVWAFGPRRVGGCLLLDPAGKGSLRCDLATLIDLSTRRPSSIYRLILTRANADRLQAERERPPDHPGARSRQIHRRGHGDDRSGDRKGPTRPYRGGSASTKDRSSTFGVKDVEGLRE